MPNFLENFLIAAQILKKVKSQVISSRDILSTDSIPEGISAEERIRIATHLYGEDKAKQAIRFTEIINKIRSEVGMYAKQLPYGNTIMYLATVFLGVGECSEQSTLVMMELLKMKRFDLCLLCIKSKFSLDDPRVYTHYMCLFGLSDKQASSIHSLADLKNLPDMCIAIDPLFGHAGKANQLHLSLKSQFEHYGLTDIIYVNRFEENSVKIIGGIEANAQKIAQLVRSNSDNVDKLADITLFKEQVARARCNFSSVQQDSQTNNKSVFFYHLPSSLKNELDTATPAELEIFDSMADQKSNNGPHSLLNTPKTNDLNEPHEKNLMQSIDLTLVPTL